MIINRIYCIRHKIILGILPILFCFITNIQSLAQEKSDDEVRITNLKWTFKEEVIIINYDLIGTLERNYKVNVTMKRKGDPSFSVVPKTVEGDIGIGNFAGTNREIQWYYRSDYPNGFKDDRYYFEIDAKPISEGSNLIYYIAGGAVAVGGLVVLLSSKSKSSSSQSIELPNPPGRP